MFFIMYTSLSTGRLVNMQQKILTNSDTDRINYRCYNDIMPLENKSKN